MAAPTDLSVVDIIGEGFRLRPLDAIKACSGKVYPISICGIGRAGKSELCNCLAAALANDGEGRKELFKTSALGEPCTLGIQLVIIPHPKGGHWLLFDCEGTDNGDTTHHPTMLAMMTHISSAFICVESKTFSAVAIGALSKMVNYSLEGGVTEFPQLVCVGNMFRLKLADNVDEDGFLESLLRDEKGDTQRNPDRANIRAAYPEGHRKFFRFPMAKSLERRSDPESEYGSKVRELAAHLLATTKSYKVAVDGGSKRTAAVNGQAYARMLKEMHGRFMANKIAPQPTAFTALVNQMAEKADAAALKIFDARVAKLPTTGEPTPEAAVAKVRSKGEKAVDDCLRAWDDHMPEDFRSTDYVQRLRKQFKVLREAHIEALVITNEAEGAITGHEKETKTEVLSTRHRVLLGKSKRRVWFHEDVTKTYADYETQQSFYRTKMRRANGKTFYQPDWTPVDEPCEVEVRRYTDDSSYTVIF